MPETWTKSTPESGQMSTNRNGPGAASTVAGAGAECAAFAAGSGPTGIDGWDDLSPPQPDDTDATSAIAANRLLIPDVPDRRPDIHPPPAKNSLLSFRPRDRLPVE